MLRVYFRDIVYMAPSGVQKERVQTEDIFVSNMRSGNILSFHVSYVKKNIRVHVCVILI